MSEQTNERTSVWPSTLRLNSLGQGACPPFRGRGSPGDDDGIAPVGDLFLDVLDEEGRSSEVVDGDVEEALDLLLMKVHGDDVSHARPNQHLSQEFADDRTALPHLSSSMWKWEGEGRRRWEVGGCGRGKQRQVTRYSNGRKMKNNVCT